ncbi:serine/threonine-protein kinase ATM-like [Rhododendron vialii]|uniref:serine/threonine-protein kinase ATM-like n=1 Tax=Rhododendron vialii TaxID=182163 RepID=UPI00265EE657|nr:serine/threonine-protein kinase ATM-like [Rhododendron vialii]
MLPLSFLITSFQYEAAWRAGNWDFSLLSMGDSPSRLSQDPTRGHFQEHLYSCLRALQEGYFREFHSTLRDSKQELVLSITHASKESTEYIYSMIIKLQVLISCVSSFSILPDHHLLILVL